MHIKCVSAGDGLSHFHKDHHLNSALFKPTCSNNRVIWRKVFKSSAIRTTCEGCRKLHIKCTRDSNDQSYMKCADKGRDCVYKPRAPYPARKKKAM